MNKVNYIDTTVSFDFEGARITVKSRDWTLSQPHRKASLYFEVYNDGDKLSKGSLRDAILERFIKSEIFIKTRESQRSPLVGEVCLVAQL